MENKKDTKNKTLTESDLAEIDAFLNDMKILFDPTFTAAKWMEFYQKAFELCAKINFSSSAEKFDIMTEKIIELVKSKEEQQRVTVWRIFGYMWRFIPQDSKYKDISTTYLKLTV